MYEFNHMKEVLLTTFGIFGGLIANMLGGWSNDLNTLFIFMVADFVLGVVVALCFHASPKTENGRLQSSACWKGFWKKAGMLLLVAIGYHLDLLLGANYIRTAIIIGLILNELLSIIENLGLMGVPMPSVVTEAVEILKQKSGGENHHV